MPPAWARALVLGVSLSPIFVAPIAVISLETILGSDGFFWLIAAWLASALPIFIINLHLESWRSPVEARSRAAARAMYAMGMHILLPMVAQVIAIALCAICL